MHEWQELAKGRGRERERVTREKEIREREETGERESEVATAMKKITTAAVMLMLIRGIERNWEWQRHIFRKGEWERKNIQKW